MQEQSTEYGLLKKLSADLNRNAPSSQVFRESVTMSFYRIFNCLENCQPDHLGLEFTREQTLYVFSKTGKWDIHLETDFEESPFCTMSIFESDEIAVNMSAKLENCLKKLSKLTGPASKSSETASCQ